MSVHLDVILEQDDGVFFSLLLLLDNNLFD